MKQDLNKSQSSDAENIRNMVLSFTQCADATSDLSSSIENFNKVYKNVEKNITKLKKIDDNISSNEQIRELLTVTDNMTDIFSYFNNNLPKLTDSIVESKKEIESYKKNFKDMTKYFENLNNEISNTDLDFEKKLLAVIEQKIDSILEEKTYDMMGYLKELSNSQRDAVQDNKNITDCDTIYNLYVANSRKLPMNIKIESWTENYDFTVETIEATNSTEILSLTAFGKRYIDGKFKDDFSISADLKQFKICQE